MNYTACILYITNNYLISKLYHTSFNFLMSPQAVIPSLFFKKKMEQKAEQNVLESGNPSQ